MKASRLRKLTWKVVVVYAAAILLVGFADPDPRKFRHAVFWVGLGTIGAGLALRLWAAGHLRKNRTLTVTGPYAYVKNPLYLGTFLAMTGFAVLAQGDPEQPKWYWRHFNWIFLGAGGLVFLGYYVPYKKRRESERLRERFGDDWDHYDRNVPDYLPRWSRYERASAQPWNWATACANSEPWTPLALTAAVAAVLFNQALLDLASRGWL